MLKKRQKLNISFRSKSKKKKKMNRRRNETNTTRNNATGGKKQYIAEDFKTKPNIHLFESENWVFGFLSDGRKRLQVQDILVEFR